MVDFDRLKLNRNFINKEFRGYLKNEVNVLDAKAKFERLALTLCDHSGGLTLDALHRIFVKKWVAKKGPTFLDLRSTLQDIKAL